MAVLNRGIGTADPRSGETLPGYVTHRTLPRILALTGIAIVGIITAYEIAPYSIVAPTEMGGERFLGRVTSAKPLSPGFYAMGVTGAEGINANIDPVIQDRALRVSAARNTVS